MSGRLLARWLGLCLMAVLGAAGLASAQAGKAAPIVYVVPINGTIDLGLAPFLARAVREATEAGASAVVVEINTFGGRVDAAVAMRDTLLNAPIRTIAFINPRAISAGALIALACNTIIMATGGTIGAAAPVVAGSDGNSKPADEKSVSYVRKEFRATAESRHRPLEIAEAMVDADVEIPGVSPKGKLLTLTTEEALQHKVADLTAPTIEAALTAAGLPNAELRRVGPTWAETLVRFLTQPAVASLLMTVGILGIIVELRTPGFAVPGVVGLLSLGLFFWGHWIVQLAGWEELLLVLVGAVLVAVEVFVIPGFTVFGIAGIVALVAGLGLAMVGVDVSVSSVTAALGRVAISTLLAMAGALALFRFLPRLPFGRRLVLETGMDAGHGYISAPETDRRWLGRSGTAMSPLRPAGIAEIDGTRVDVVSDGAFLDAGTVIEVTRVDGNRIVVRGPVSHQEPSHE
ncbi:MAG: NfeD family protein [Vicinamibacterales bacterium]